MILRLQKKYALSRQGAIDLIKGILLCTLQNFSSQMTIFMGFNNCYILL